MADHVRVDFDELKKVQERLVSASGELTSAGLTINEARQPIKDGAWAGEAFEAYAKEHAAAVPAYNQLRILLHDAAARIGEIAQILREAEEETGR